MKRISRLAVFASAAALLLAPLTPVRADQSIEDNLKSIMSIICGIYEGEEAVPIASGSGVIAYDNVVVTNAHVAFLIDEYEDVYYYDWCIGGIAPNSYTEPVYDFLLDYTDAWAYNEFFDYAFLEAYDARYEDYPEAVFESETAYGNADSLVIGNDLMLIGYPAVAGETITSTFGKVSGFSGTNWIKTDAAADFGNSGGGAFDSNGNIIGIPTIVVAGDLNSFTYVQNLNAIMEDAFGPEVIVRDYETIYTTGNVTCFYTGECYNFGEGEELSLGEEANLGSIEEGEASLVGQDQVSGEKNGTSGFILEGLYDPSQQDIALQDRLTGYILLQIQQNGEAWYVNPDDQLRYYMRDGAVAYEMMRSFGLGITDANLAQIPAVEDAGAMLSATSVCATNPLADRVKGQILLQVEQHGEAWYVHPDTCRRIYMKDGNAAYDIMRFLSLGITDGDLSKLPSGSIQ